MTFVVALFGAAIAVLGILGLVRPSALMRFVQAPWRSRTGLYLENQSAPGKIRVSPQAGAIARGDPGIVLEAGESFDLLRGFFMQNGGASLYTGAWQAVYEGPLTEGKLLVMEWTGA